MRPPDRRLHLGLPALSSSGRLSAAALALALALAGVLVPAVQPAIAQQLAPVLELQPSCTDPALDVVTTPNLTVNVRGHSFAPGTTVVVEWWDRQPDTQRPSVGTDEFGRFETTVTVRQPNALGRYRVWVTAQDSDSVLSEAYLLVPCPGTVSLTPGCAELPPDGGQVQVGVSGQGWFNHFTFVVSFVGAGGTYAQTEISVANGSFSTSLSPPSLRGAPALTEGVYGVVVTPRAIEGPAPEPVATVPFTIPCHTPSVTLAPDCGPAGSAPQVYDIELSGTGFVPLAAGTAPGVTIGPQGPVGYLEVIFDVGGIPQRFVHAAAVGADGSVAPFRIQPFQRGGPVSVRVRQVLAPAYVLLETTVPFNVPCPETTAPSATIQPANCSAPAFEGDDPNRRYSLTVTGQGFAPDAPVQVFFDALGTSGYAVEEFAGTAGADGTFSVPLSPLARPVGRYELHVTQQPLRVEPIVLQLPFEVPCPPPRSPTLNLACDPLEPVAPDAGEVVIESSGWFENAPIVVSVPGLTSETVLTDGVGRYTRRLAAAGLPDGALEVVAVQRDVRGAVVAEARAIIALPCGTPVEPLLRVLPETVPPGFVVTVQGDFFPAGEQVDLVWDRGLRAGQPATVTVDDTGTFRLQVLVFHRDFLGPREVMAVGPGDEPLTDAAQLLVVPGRGSPPGFVPAEGLTFEPDTRLVFRR